jgi:3-oxoacyl-(acyl-carrier-protein) synthase
MRLPPDAIDDVNEHATSPRAGDVAATNAVTHVFGHRSEDFSIE